MRTVVTGMVGLDKGTYLKKVVALAEERGHDVALFNVGERMYAEAPDVAPGRILDLPISRLSSLRRSIFKDALTLAEKTEHVIVNTHATFRWKHGLFPAFDFDQLAQFDADLYISLLDDVDAVHARLERDHLIDHSLKDLLVWREEETLATEMMMLGCRHIAAAPKDDNNAKDNTGHARFYTLAIGREDPTIETFYRLMFKPQMPRAYLSFPMTHVTHLPDVLAEINAFRRCLSEQFIVFDPSDLEEQVLYMSALQASEQGQKVMELERAGQRIRVDVADVLQVAGDIHGQIYARDFMLIDQADMIISFIPELPNGTPGLSSGVERELQHAHEATREVYIIWRPRMDPSPFVTETATKIFSTVDEALDYFAKVGYTTGGSGRPPGQSTLFPVW